MKKYIRIALVVAFLLSALSTAFLYRQNNILQDKLSVSVSNEKAYADENSILKDKNRVFQFTVDQLEYYNDSLLTKMNDVRKELQIKDRDLKQMQYLLSEAQKKDTVISRDTLFRVPLINVVTL